MNEREQNIEAAKALIEYKKNTYDIAYPWQTGPVVCTLIAFVIYAYADPWMFYTWCVVLAWKIAAPFATVGGYKTVNDEITRLLAEIKE